MKVQTLHVPEEWIKLVDQLLKKKLIPSKAEFYRTGIIHSFRELKAVFPAKKDLLPLLEDLEEILCKKK